MDGLAGAHRRARPRRPAVNSATVPAVRQWAQLSGWESSPLRPEDIAWKRKSGLSGPDRSHYAGKLC